MQIWAESGKSALPICNYSQILYQFLTFTQNLKRSLDFAENEFPTLLLIFTDFFEKRQSRIRSHSVSFSL